MSATYELVLSDAQWEQLHAHLFPGDDDEHGAIILAGIARTPHRVRLIARDLLPAVDGVDYVPGTRGYRMLTGSFITQQISRAEAEGLAYIAVHCHGGHDYVSLSGADRRSHERGYPALLDILQSLPVTGAVFTAGAAAGDVWLPDRSRHPLDRVVVNGSPRMVLTPQPLDRRGTDSRFDRQVLLFGDRGQDILSELTVAIIGCGGIGSVLVELLARLGVGHLIVIDSDIVEPTNLPRLVGATRRDAMEWLTRQTRPRWVRRVGARFARKKVHVAARIARIANPKCIVTIVDGDVSHTHVAAHLGNADYMFLAADTDRARLVANAVSFQYSIPGIQLGSKVQVHRASGRVVDVFAVVRPFGPTTGCLMCNGLISAERLASDAISPERRAAQRYVNDEHVRAPSVITLNAQTASHASNIFLFNAVGLAQGDQHTMFTTFHPLTGDIEHTAPRRSPNCTECGDSPASRRGRGDTVALPTTDR